MSTELLRVEFRIVVLDRDEDGTPTGERIFGDGAVYPKMLDELPGKVREAVEQSAQAE